jgi:hypothetical protein
MNYLASTLRDKLHRQYLHSYILKYDFTEYACYRKQKVAFPKIERGMQTEA